MEHAAARAAADSLAEIVPRLARMIANALETDPTVALSLRQYRLLERLSERPHRTSELATTVHVSQPTASGAIAALENRGLVARSADPSDRRATLIALTADGAALLEISRDRVRERLERITRDIEPADAALLGRLVPVLAEGMDRTRDEVRADRARRSAAGQAPDGG